MKNYTWSVKTLANLLSLYISFEDVAFVAQYVEAYRTASNKKKVYICSPLHGDTNEQIKYNMLAAQAYIEEAEAVYDVKAIATHAVLPPYIDDNVPMLRNIALGIGIDAISRCKILFVCGTKLSEGMIGEIAYAIKHRMVIAVFRDDLVEEIQLIARQIGYPCCFWKQHSGLLSMDSQKLGIWQSNRIKA